jgi:rhodanese-related sulfurtransferase
MRLLLATLLVAGAAYQAPRVAPAAVAERKDVVFVDTRSRAAYDQEHIAGAVSVPNSALDRSAQGLPKDKTLVLYCTCPEEHGALAGAAKLHDRYGYKKLAVLEGGLDAWREAGYEVASGPRPRPTPRPTPKPTPRPTPTATPMTPPEQRDPMDEQRGTTQTP